MRHGEGGVETPSIVVYDVELIVDEGGGRIIDLRNNPENTSIAIRTLPRTIQGDNAAEAEDAEAEGEDAESEDSES
jgi:hypothetical protein